MSTSHCCCIQETSSLLHPPLSRSVIHHERPPSRSRQACPRMVQRVTQIALDMDPPPRPAAVAVQALLLRRNQRERQLADDPDACQHQQQDCVAAPSRGIRLRRQTDPPTTRDDPIGLLRHLDSCRRGHPPLDHAVVEGATVPDDDEGIGDAPSFSDRVRVPHRRRRNAGGHPRCRGGRPRERQAGRV